MPGGSRPLHDQAARRSPEGVLACAATLSGLFRPPVGRPVSGPAAAGADEGPCDPSQWAGGPDAEAPAPPVRPMDRVGVLARRPSLTLGRIGLASHPPPKRRLQTPPRTRLVNRFPDPPGYAVSSPSVVRMRRPRSSTLRWIPSGIRSAPFGVEPPVKVTTRKVPGWSTARPRFGRRDFATPICFSRPAGSPGGRGKPRESIGRSLNPLGAPCRSHSGPKAGPFPATEEPSRTLRPASGSPPLQ